MLWINVLIIGVTILLGVRATYVLYNVGRKSTLRVPIFLFSSAVLSITLGFVFIDIALVILLLQHVFQYSILPIFFYRLGFILEMVGSYLGYLTLTLPRFKENSLQSLFYQLIAVSIFGAAAAINATTVSVQQQNSNLIVMYDSAGLLLLLIAIGFLVIALVLRMRDIERVMTSKNLKNTYMLQIWGVVILVFLTIGFILLGEIITIIEIPNFTWTLLIGIFFSYISLAVSKNEGFLFAIPVRIETLYILDSSSGLVLYSRSFSDAHPQSETLLGSMLGGLKKSLEALITSKAGLRTIVFEDKVIVMHSGSYVTTFLVVSDVNPLIFEITAKLTSLFEATYHEQITSSRKQRVFKPREFSPFDQSIERINKQLLL